MHGFERAIIPVAVILAGIIFVYWRNTNVSYRCDNCGNIFSLPLWEAVVAPHAGGKKLVKCPQCGKRSWKTQVAK